MQPLSKLGHFVVMFVVVLGLAHVTLAADAKTAKSSDIVFQDRVLGKADAPIKVDEYVSLTCSHCAEFYNITLPVLEKRYVDTGKVKFIMHDFVMDHLGLQAAVLARCMPADEFYPFVKILYSNQQAWALSSNPENVIVSYAKLGGLPEDQAKACLQNSKMQDAVVAERNAGEEKAKIEATPTFIVNDGVETISGAQPVEEFAKVFDRLLAAQK